MLPLTAEVSQELLEQGSFLQQQSQFLVPSLAEEHFRRAMASAANKQ